MLKMLLGLRTRVALPLASRAAGVWRWVRSIRRSVGQPEPAEQCRADDAATEQVVIIHTKEEFANLLRCLRQMERSLALLIRNVAASAVRFPAAPVASIVQAPAVSHHAEGAFHKVSGEARASSGALHRQGTWATRASQAAQRSGEVVQQVVSSMEEIASASKRIVDVVGMVDGIAFQTNLLALNAAVEAARVGDRGGRFAVVAAEVRGVAQRSAEAARDIKTLIGTSVKKVESGAELVALAGDCMGEIAASIHRLNQMMSQMNALTAQPGSGFGLVSTVVKQLDEMTQHNAPLVEKSAAAAQGMREQAQRLSDAVHVFQLIDTHALGAAIQAEEVIGRVQQASRQETGPKA